MKNFTVGNGLKMNKGALPWHIVEAAIRKEADWLKTVLIPFGKKDDQFLYSYRKVAEMVVCGEVSAKEIKSSELWGVKIKNISYSPAYYHGHEWHQKMMQLIENYFISQGYEVSHQPWLNQGKADLGIYKEGFDNLFVEIGTVSPYKIMINLNTMPSGTIFLVAPNEDKVIEFIKLIKNR